MTIPSIPGVNLPAGLPDPNAIAGQVTQAAQGAAAQGVAAGSAAANSALTGMGVPPGVANQVTGALSGEAMKGFHAALRAISGFPGHVFGGLFHHHHHVHAIPQVAQVVSSLPPAQQAGANAALNIVNATMAGQTAAIAASAPAGAPPAQVAAAIQAAGTPPPGTPGAAKSATHPLVYGGVAAVVTGGVALALKAAYPIAAAVAGAGAVLGYLIGHHSEPPAPSAHGDSEAEALLSFMRHNGVPSYPAQEVYDFQVAAGLQPQDGRYTPQVQVALAMSPVITGTVPNPVLK